MIIDLDKMISTPSTSSGQTSPPQIALFGLSANPPANHHLLIVLRLIEIFGKVIVIPRGTDSNKPSTAETAPLQRKEMVKLAFSSLPNIEIDFYDLDNNIFTPTGMIDQKYKTLFPDLKIWHVIGGDLVKGGASGKSQIQTRWRKGKEIWNNLNWTVIDHPDFPIDPKDLPPNNTTIKMNRFSGRSTAVRERIRSGQPITGLVPIKVEEYIIKNNLYK